MKKTLIVYHSRTGHTRRVAQALARRLDADVEEIRIVQPMDGWLGYMLCAIESLAALTPALRPMRSDAAGYDLVVVGTPVWFWNVSSPVRSWLEANAPARRIAFFCTMGGSGASRAFSSMAELAGREPVATLGLTEREADARLDDLLEPFVRALKAGRPARASRDARPRAAHAAT